MDKVTGNAQCARAARCLGCSRTSTGEYFVICSPEEFLNGFVIRFVAFYAEIIFGVFMGE